MGQVEVPANPSATVLRESLRRVRFRVEACVALGRMTVGNLLDVRPGTIVRSATPPCGKITLRAGRVEIASGEPVVEAGALLIRIDAVGGGGRD